jgi:exodeoxyribonuclease-3
VRVGCIYLPNGNPIGTEKFAYKLRWMARLKTHARDGCWPLRSRWS